MPKRRPSWLLIVILYTISFLDMAGIGLVYVVFEPLIIDPNPLLPAGPSLGTRNVILGLLFAAYPVTQFFGAPILGEISDQLGRKKPLVFSTFFTAVAFFLSALAVWQNSLSLLFLSRLLSGLTAGNLTISQALVGDLIEAKKRAPYMAAFTITGGVAWAVSPYLGSILADAKLVSWFSPSLPFITLGVLFLLSGLTAYFALHEEEKSKKLVLHLRIFKDLWKTLETPVISPLLLISLVSIFGWMIFQGFMSPYLGERYHFSPLWIGETFTYFCAWYFIGGLVANLWLFKRLNIEKTNVFFLILVPFCVFSFLWLTKSTGIWYASAVANFSQSIATASFFALFSLLAAANIQGKVFGFWNAGYALSSALGPVIGGVLANIQINVPFFTASLILSAAAILYIFWLKRRSLTT
ncbi:MAG: multidrug efflux MFS transporter NorA [Simkaniaceae bacterium]